MSKRKHEEDEHSTPELEAAINATSLPLEERNKYIKENEEHPDYMVLTSVLESVVGLISGFNVEDFTELQFQKIGRYIEDETDLHPPALMMLTADVLSDAMRAANKSGNLDLAEAQLLLVESGWGKELSKAAHILFLAGVMFNQRHTGLMAELLMNQENDDRVRAIKEQLAHDPSGS